MALPSKETLGLIQWLATTDEEALHTLADLRGLSANDLSSLTTLAQALLGEAEVGKALSRQSRSTLKTLVALTTPPVDVTGHDLTPLTSWGLVDQGSTPPQLLFPPEALAVLSGLDFSEPEPSVAGCGMEPTEGIESCARGVQAVLAQLSDVLDTMSRRPFAAGKNETLSANGLKALTDVIGSGYDIVGLVSMARTARLVAVGPKGLQATQHANSWRHQTAEQQWLTVAGCWWAELPEWVGAVITSYPTLNWLTELPQVVGYHYPLLQQSDAIALMSEQATLLGVIHKGCATPWGQQLFTPTGTVGLAEHFVDPVGGVYASEDFTLVASGPLRLDHRVILDAIAHRELGGVVPRYRVTSRSLLRALQSGVAPSDIQSSLEGCSLTPLPNGMLHLIEDTCRKAGEIELHHSRNGTILKVARPELAEELLLDPSLNGLSLRELDEKTLVSPLPIERVNDFVIGSRYLALIHDEQPPPGGPELVEVPDDPAQAKLHAAVTALHETIQSAARHGVPPSLGSVLEVAIASKVPLDITVEMPGGELVSLVMEPRSVGGGRLRGVEIKNSMEKTIPVSSIRSAIPWTPPVS